MMDGDLSTTTSFVHLNEHLRGERQLIAQDHG